ncbi:MAG: hypothetical protein CVV42_20580 [Candidatus Riflebacteria bacterium HGW-Riflebacteria-2]|jgi:hypothetical protein|nr:MAG: hypothetical protein CVV42_20580 [Candidatus Riflebacteria bacterium HGW-Riflebacteria-2]
MKIRKVCTLAVIIVTLFASPAYAQEKESELPVVIAYQIDRAEDFLNEPGNNPIEILRRLGRSLNTQWTANKTSLLAASLFDSARIGGPEFLKPLPETLLSADQKKAAAEMLKRHETALQELVNACKPASQAIIIKVICENVSLKKAIDGSTEADDAKAVKKPAMERARKELMPILEASDYMAGALVVSTNGCFGKLKIVSEKNLLANDKIEHNISIGRYINHDALMFFCQTHPIENPAEAFKELSAIPQSATVVNMVASAGIDFEKDILTNTARESILYVNLEPSGDGGIPDIRFVAPVPDIEKLRNNLDKFKQLCQQTGIFVQPLEGDFPMVKLSYFMLPQAAVYAGLYNGFLVITSAQSNLAKELTHLKDVATGSQKAFEMPEKLKRFWKIRTDDFNLQLQKLLQSPILAAQGIPPITNLTFLEDIEHIIIKSSALPSAIEFSLEIPLKAKQR